MNSTKRRKLMSFFMACCMMMTLAFSCVPVKAAVTSDGFSYEYYQDTYTNQAGIIITGYQGNQESIVVPEQIEGYPVLKLGAAFYQNTTVKSIILPESLLEIGENAFSGCSSLNCIDVATTEASAVTTQTEMQNTTQDYNGNTTQDANLQDGNTTVQSTNTTEAVTTQQPANSNSQADKKGKVILPATVRSLGNGAFDNCTSIEEVHINRDLTSVGVRCFYMCTSLRKFVVEENNNCFVADAYGVLYQKYVGEDLSAYTGVASDPFAVTYHLVRWPHNAPMNTYDFSANGGYYPMHENMTKIEPYAFENANFSGIGLKIGAPCYVIGDYAFNQCKNLSGGVIFDPACATVMLCNYAFSGNETIHELTLPATVKTVGAYCFAYCTNLDTVYFNQGIESIMEGAFLGCRTLHTINIPEGITTIENATFSECTNLGIVVLPDSLTTIGSEAFKNCVTIHEMVIPPNVTYVDNTSFTGANLEKIDFSQNIIVAKKLGIEGVEAEIKTPSFVLGKGDTAKISIKLNGDQLKKYTLNKAAKKKIKINQKGKITVKKNAKKGIAKVTVKMKSGLKYVVKVYVTDAKIVKVNKKKAITVKLKKKAQLTYTKNPLAVQYKVPKAYKKYIQVTKYGTITAKKYTSKTLYIKVNNSGKTIKQKIKITK